MDTSIKSPIKIIFPQKPKPEFTYEYVAEYVSKDGRSNEMIVIIELGTTTREQAIKVFRDIYKKRTADFVLHQLVFSGGRCVNRHVIDLIKAK